MRSAISEPPATFGRWLRFASVGLAATMVHALTLFALVEGAGVVALWANLIGFCAAFSVSYFGHYYFTFRSHRTHRRALPGFAMSAAIGAGLNIGIFLIIMQGLGANYWAAFACVVTIVPIVVYSLAKGLAFGIGEG